MVEGGRGDEPPRLAVEDDGPAIPEACRAELKEPMRTINLVTASAAMTSVGSIVDAERCSSHQKLFGVTANFLKFVRKCRKQIVGGRSDPIDEAEQLWKKEIQCSQLAHTNRIKKAKVQLRVFTENGVWRCGGRLREQREGPLSSLSLKRLATSGVEFFFNETMFRQIEGVARGSPLGPALANIFIEFYERKIPRQRLASNVPPLR